MSGPLLLALRHLAAHPLRTALLAGCLAVALALPAAGRVLVVRFDAALHARAASTPLVVGAKGSRFDLVFAALHFRRADIDPTPWSAYEALLTDDRVRRAIPVNARFAARNEPIVATSVEYFEMRGLAIASGRRIARTGEALVGAAAARRLDVEPGGSIFSDQRDLYDITAPPSLKLAVVGVLQPAGTPDDHAVFVAIETAWVLEGIAHGHDDAATIVDDQKIIGRSDEHVALSGAVIEYQEITAANVATFHVHGARDDLPLSAVLVEPIDDKSATILASRINASPARQALVPTRVVEELVGFVVRVRRVFDAIAIILAASTAALLVLIGALSWRIRVEEIRTLTEIGCGRSTIGLLFGLEYAAILAMAAAGAAVLVVTAVVVVSRITVLM